MSFQKRINYQGDLKKLLNKVCNDFNLGKYNSHKVLEIGYEDFNLILTTSKDKYFVKLFATYRTIPEIRRYVDIMKQAIDYDINYPKLEKTNSGDILYTLKLEGERIDLVVMEYVPYPNIYENRVSLKDKEVRWLTKQAARINQLDIQVPEVYDSWSIVYLDNEYQQIKDELSKKDFELVTPIIQELAEKVDFKELPQSFVHGDLTRSNLIKGKDKIYILDFSVANNYPRIQEMGVLYANTVFDPNDIKNSKRHYELMIESYNKVIPLENREIEILPLYVKACFATNIIGCLNSRKEGFDNEETDYWLNLGRKGLRKFEYMDF